MLDCRDSHTFKVWESFSYHSNSTKAVLPVPKLYQVQVVLRLGC